MSHRAPPILGGPQNMGCVMLEHQLHKLHLEATKGILWNPTWHQVFPLQKNPTRLPSPPRSRSKTHQAPPCPFLCASLSHPKPGQQFLAVLQGKRQVCSSLGFCTPHAVPCAKTPFQVDPSLLLHATGGSEQLPLASSSATAISMLFACWNP